MDEADQRELYLNLYDDAEQNSLINDDEKVNQRYIDKKLIGEGGVKRVYQAYDPVLDRFVALAELKHSNTELKREAFLREAQLTAQLDHPNIISIYDLSNQHQERPWFTMELKSGISFEKQLFLKKGSPFIERQELLEQYLKVCDAIDYSHSNNIVHLDLKPDNIQIGQHGEVLVCDWGLGQMLSIDDHDELIHADTEHLEFFKDMTITGKINGTPGYMAPEQITQKESKGKHTDIYSLGALLYITLCSETSIPGDLNEILEKTSNGCIVYPKERFPHLHIPDSLNAVVRKAMQTEPNKRYASVNELTKDIRKYLSGYTTHAEQAHLLKEIYFFYKRHQLVCSLTSLALFLIFATVSIYQINLNDTLNQLNLANQSIQVQRDRTAQALDLAIKNKTWLNDLVLDNQIQLTKSVYNYCAIEIYKNPLKAMDLAVHELKLLRDANPQKSFHTTQLGYVYAIMQKFPESHKAYQEFPPPAKDTFVPIVYASQTYGAERPLAPEHLIDFLSKMTNGHTPMFALRTLYYDAKLRKNWKEHATLAHFVLKLWNPDWESDEFHYNEELKSLKLRGQGLAQLSYHHIAKSVTREWDLMINLVGSLPVNSLDLSGTDFFDFASLKDLPFKSIDISYTPISKLNEIKKFKHLSHLIIHKGQVSDANLRKVPSHIKVSYHK